MFSIIVPTKNRSHYLKSALESIVSHCSYTEDFEILIVDNGSTDTTRILAKYFIESYKEYRIKYLYEEEPGLLSGRHRGTLEAQGEVLIFIDDDVEVSSSWLQAIKLAFREASVQLVGGPSLPKYEVPPPRWLDFAWQTHQYGKLLPTLSLLDFGDEVRDIDPNYVWGLNFSIRKNALMELGGFHPDCLPKHLQYFQGDGETGLTRKAYVKGYRAVYQPQALVFHNVPKARMTTDYFEAWYFYYGICDSYSMTRADYQAGYSMIKNIKHFLKRNLSAIKNDIKQKIKFLIEDRIVLDEDEKIFLNIKKRCFLSYKEGFNFHQKYIRSNPNILDWVLRENYWNYQLPNL
ncbi:glycosyltransferase family 2 protein [Trichothermofontia sp.]